MEFRSGYPSIWRKYMYYSIFGWVYPLVIGMLAYLEYIYSVLPEYLHVSVGYCNANGIRYCILTNDLPSKYAKANKG